MLDLLTPLIVDALALKDGHYNRSPRTGQTAVLNAKIQCYIEKSSAERGCIMKHSEGFLRLVNDAKTRIKEVTVDETQERMKQNPAAKLIDVREDNEWDSSHAAGAIHLGKGIIERDIETTVPDKSTELILYCGGGYRSALAADALEQIGYTNVFSMAGGWKAWRESGGEIEQS
jgi:rhodanese-related sulfurtransferase